METIRLKAVKLFAEWKPKEGHYNKRDNPERKRAQEGNKVIYKPKAKLVQATVPELSPTDVLIKVKYTGICGSDVLMNWQGKDKYTKYPYIMKAFVTIGHEFSGEIIQLGSSVKRYAPHLGKGTPVTAQCVINCSYCKPCQEGRFDDCTNNEERGFSVDGSMAEYTKADIRHVYSLENLVKRYNNDDIFQAGALLEPLTGTYKAIIETAKGFKPGSHAVVIGGGPLGLSAISVLRAAGAAEIILSEPSERRRYIGERMGASYMINPLEENLKESVLEITKGEGAEIYFEGAGIAGNIYPEIEQIFKETEQNSKLICFGRCLEPMKVDSQALVGSYATITGSHGHCGVWKNVINLVGARRIDPKQMITRITSLENVPKYLKKLRTDKEEGKIIVKGE